MAAPTLVVVMRGESAQEYVVSPVVEVAFERKFDLPMQDMARNEHLYFLAFESKRAAGEVVPLLFDDWLKDVESVDIKETAPLGTGSSASE